MITTEDPVYYVIKTGTATPITLYTVSFDSLTKWIKRKTIYLPNLTPSDNIFAKFNRFVFKPKAFVFGQYKDELSCFR